MLERTVRFCIVAETLSIKRAAEHLRVDQSWLSRQIQQLESELGFALFKRTTRSIVLTPQGEAFLPVARELAASADKARRLAAELAQATRQDLRLGVSRYSFWMPARQKLFDAFERYPDLKVQTEVGSSGELVDKVLDDQLDAAIVVLPEPDRVDYAPLCVIRPLLLIPREQPLASAAQIRMADLAGMIMAMPRNEGTRPFQLEFQPFLDAGVTPRWVAEGMNAVFHYAAVERICCLGYPDEVLPGGDLVRREIVDSTATVEFGVVRRSGDDRAAVRKFWSCACIVADTHLSAEPLVPAEP